MLQWQGYYAIVVIQKILLKILLQNLVINKLADCPKDSRNRANNMDLNHLEEFRKKVKKFGSFAYRNEILGYFSTLKEMNKAIKEAGLVKKDGVWCVPAISFGPKPGQIKVHPRFTDYKKKQWGREKAAEENTEALKQLAGIDVNKINFQYEILQLIFRYWGV